MPITLTKYISPKIIHTLNMTLTLNQITLIKNNYVTLYPGHLGKSSNNEF